jgi:hypothetical protein
MKSVNCLLCFGGIAPYFTPLKLDGSGQLDAPAALLPGIKSTTQFPFYKWAKCKKSAGAWKARTVTPVSSTLRLFTVPELV